MWLHTAVHLLTCALTHTHIHIQVLEETPSPLLSDALREELAAAAVRLGEAAKYR